MPLTTGSRLGTYEIQSLLGAGGMGEVYRARDTRLGRDVAIKVLPESVAAHADRLARFEREARSVAALNHPNVVTLYAIEEASGIRFLSMELVDGKPLDTLVAAGGLPVPRVLKLMLPLADALVAAHEKGVVHRDLKPGNVMLTRDGRVKVLDFGLAKLTDDSALDATQAETVAAPISTAGQVVGTVPYMAPEQLRGAPTDARTDLFAFGIILYELLTGRRPFGGTTSAEVSSAILRDPPAPIENLRADLPRDLGRVIGRCLEKDPERRFQTAKDVRNELDLVRRSLEPDAIAKTAAPVAAQDVPSIAVLPFANRSRDEEDEYFAEGLADELLNVLAKIRGLRVAARTSSAQFKDTSEDVATIGRKLNVTTLLEGSLRKSGNRVRIAVQLVKVADGYHLWSETFDRTLDDIFAVQDDIAQSVVKELRTTLLGETADSKASGEVKAEVAAAAAEGRGTNPEAHRLFLQGRFFVNRMGRDDACRGIELLRKALDLEPDHALAWATLSWAETVTGIAGGSYSEAPDEYIVRARDAAHRALALSPDLPEALLALGWIQLYYDFDWTGAEASFRRALELGPGNAEALRSYGMLILLWGRFDEALSRCREAIERDPLSPASYGIIGRVYLTMQRLDEAEAAFRKALELAPDAVSLRSLIALAYWVRGDYETALAEVLQEPAPWARLYVQSIIQHSAGREEESRKALDELIEIGANIGAVQIAIACALRGEVDDAFYWMNRAYEQRDSGIVYLKVFWFLAPLHHDPRWKPFLAKLNFPA